MSLCGQDQLESERERESESYIKETKFVCSYTTKYLT